MFFLEFVLSRACNQKCNYCTTYTKGRKFEVDIKFISEILSYIPEGLNLEIVITGGEPGLCENLYDVMDVLSKRKNTKIRSLSNGLVRKKYPDIPNNKNIFYFEHLWETYNNKFYELDFFEENDLNNYNVIVVTNEFIEKYKLSDLPIHKNTWFKLVNLKSKNDTLDKNKDKFLEFYRTIKDKTALELNFDIFEPTNSQRRACSSNPPVPFINIEDKTIGHCSKILNESLTVPFNEENFNLLLHSNLFNVMPEYCKKCYDVNTDNRIKHKIFSLKGKYINKSKGLL